MWKIQCKPPQHKGYTALNKRSLKEKKKSAITEYMLHILTVERWEASEERGLESQRQADFFFFNLCI